ncbi:MAG: xanthine dehydrogenase family protein molybdopterin-binding subunit [Methylovirgula sp.]
MTTRHGPAYALVRPAALTNLSRRHLLQASGGFLLAFAADSARSKAHAANPTTKPGYDGFKPAGFIRISKQDGIVLIIPNTEMGQDIYTGEAMLIAEELEAGLDQLKVVAAPPDATLYTDQLLGEQATGGSTSVRAAWLPLRQAGAVTRTMLIAAAAAQWNVPVAECSAKRAVVTHQPTGRTLSYTDLGDAAFQQPVPQQVTLKSLKDFTLIGKSTRRIEGPDKINGTAQFGIDCTAPGMKFATVAACPVFGGKLADVDEKAARAVPGVVDIIRIEDAVAVIGDHFWAAQRGLDALRIRWDEGANRDLTTEQLRDQLKSFSQDGNAIVARKEGDIDGAFHQATTRLDATYELPFLAHAAMEPINTLIHVKPDSCEIWVGTQVPVRAQMIAAKVTGLPPEKVIVHNQLIGGGFGRRLTAETVGQAAAIAKQVSYPVKIIWTRAEDIQHDVYRPAYYDRISAGFGPDGMPTVWVDHITGASVLGRFLPTGLPEGALDFDAVEGAKENPYAFPAVQVDWVRADPPIPISWWRGVGPTHNVFVVESFMDEMAHAAGRDPVAYRLALLGKTPRVANVLKLAAEKSGWGSPLPSGRGRGVAVHNSFGSNVAAVIDIAVSANGEITLQKIVIAIDCGLCVNPNAVDAQMSGGMIFGLTAALYSDITFKNGRVQQSNFNDYRVMRMDQTPPIEVYIVPSSESPGGIGEVATAIAAPTLGNAIFAATGKRLRRYPFDTKELHAENAAHTVFAELLPTDPAAVLAEAAELAS